MALDVNSNKYTFGFAAVMVIIVASLLAFTSESLKDRQKGNVRKEKMQNILSSVGVAATAEEAEELYNKYITADLVLNLDGDVVAQEGGFTLDVLGQYRDKAKKDADKRYPLFVFNKDGRTSYIVPLVGTGLWGPIWGYMAIASDGVTVEGATFDHKGETPGLGAEIATSAFQQQFVGLSNFEKGEFAPIKAVKGGATEGDMHGVDAISGGTITSDGLTKMIANTMTIYVKFFKDLQAKQNQPVEVTMVTDSLATDTLSVASTETPVAQ